MTTVQDHIREFDSRYPEARGDGYAFAEYLCGEVGYFGPLDADTSDLESAWMQAEDWYRAFGNTYPEKEETP